MIVRDEDQRRRYEIRSEGADDFFIVPLDRPSSEGRYVHWSDLIGQPFLKAADSAIRSASG